MASDANGVLIVPVWSDGGTVKPVVNDDGRIDVTIGESVITQDVNIASSDIDVPVSIDAQDITLDINLKSSDITLAVAEQSPLSSIQAQGYGWDLTAWRKLPMLFGYSGVVRQYGVATSTGAGTYRVVCTAVPTGWLYVMEGFIVAQTDTVNRGIKIGVYNGTSYYGTTTVPVAVPSGWYGHPIHMVMKEDEQFYAECYFSAAGKVLSLFGVGYSMKVNA